MTHPGSVHAGQPEPPPGAGDPLGSVRDAVLSAKKVQAAGAGKAYQAIAQSAAIAVQDATDNLRNLATISTTAVGVAMAQLLATGDVDKYKPVVQEAQKIWKRAAKTYETVGSSAQQVLADFSPSGGGPSGPSKQ